MITVHGYLGVPDVAVCERVMTADLVVAPARVLDALAVPAARRVPLAPVDQAEQALAEADPDLDIRVLASGDPAFFGILRRLRRAGLSCRARPGVSSVAAAFAAVALPWDDAVVATAHGRDLAPVLAACRARPKVAVLTAPGAGAVEIARGLADLRRWYVVAERLGETDERVRVLDGPTTRTATDIADPHVVIALAHPVHDPLTVGTTGAFAGGAGQRAADGVREPVSLVAAAAFGRLQPTLGDLVWVAGDVGHEVGRLAGRCGAAVVALGAAELTGGSTPATRPTHIVCDDPARLPDPAAAPMATRLLVTSARPDPMPPGVASCERLDVSTTDGVCTAYLTLIPGGAE